MPSASTLHPAYSSNWQRFAATAVRGFHVYAGWLVSISWRRVLVLSVLLASIGIVHDLPPFTWRITEETTERARRVIVVPPPPPAVKMPPVEIVKPEPGSKCEGVDISIGKDGIKITPKPARPDEAASIVASGALPLAIKLPEGATREEVRQAVQEAREQIEESVREAREAAEQAVRDAEEARRDAKPAIEALKTEGVPSSRIKPDAGSGRPAAGLRASGQFSAAAVASVHP